MNFSMTSRLGASVLLASISLSAIATDYKPSSDGKAIFENLHIASQCVTGFSAATYFVGGDHLTSEQVEYAVHMAKVVCIDDTFVISIYNSMKNGPDNMSLDEARAYAEKIVADWMSGNLETLRASARTPESP